MALSWRRSGRLSRLGALLALAVASPAAAAERPIAIDIPVQARERALVTLGVQAGVSLGLSAGVRCPGRAGLVGRMTLAQALDRLLAGSACAAVRPDQRTVVIIAAGALPPSPPRPPRPAAEPSEVGELVVTATKRPTRLDQAPYALTAVTGAALVRQGVVDVRDLSLMAAGVTVTNLGPGRDKILLRGLSDGPLTGHTQSTVGIYLDDLRLTYSAPDPDVRWTDVARVEVLRGPQGSLYGAGSIGGVVHMVTTPPDPEARSGWLSATVGTTAHGAGSHVLEGAFNQPMPGGRAALRISGWTEAMGGYIDNLALSSPNVDRTSRQGLRASVLWSPRDDLTLDAAVLDQTISSRDTHYAQPAAGSLARATAGREPHDNDFLALDLGARWRPAWGELALSLGATDHDVGSRYDASGAPAALVQAGAAPVTYVDDNEIRGLVMEARLSSRLDRRLQWLAGVFTAEGDQRLKARLTDIRGAAAYDESRRDRLTESALFGEAAYAFTPTLTVTLGGRLFASSLRTHSTVDALGVARDFRGETSARGFAPKLVMAYAASSRWSVYAQAAEGYRTPGFNTSGPAGQTFAATPGAVQPLRRYAGDELWSLEAGARWSSADGAWRLRVGGFQAVWRDIQTDLLLPSGLPFTANVGDGRSTGLEAEGAYDRGGLAVAANLTVQRPELDRPDPGFPNRIDSHLPGVPALSYSLRVSYSWPVSTSWAVDIAASYAYVGSSRLTFDAVTAPRMGDYGEVRLRAGLRSARLRASLFVDNLVDSRGDTFAYGNPFTIRTSAQPTPQRPRTVGLVLGRSF